MRKSTSKPTPQKQTDESGDCRHLYLTREATCVHCGIRFRLAWQSERSHLVRPTTRNIFIGMGGAVMVATHAALALPGAAAFDLGPAP